MTDVSVTVRTAAIFEGHKHGVSIQSSINLGDTLLQITRAKKLLLTLHAFLSSSLAIYQFMKFWFLDMYALKNVWELLQKKFLDSAIKIAKSGLSKVSYLSLVLFIAFSCRLKGETVEQHSRYGCNCTCAVSHFRRNLLAAAVSAPAVAICLKIYLILNN